MLFEVGGMEGLRQSHGTIDRIRSHFSESQKMSLDDKVAVELETYEARIDSNGPHSVIRHPALQAKR